MSHIFSASHPRRVPDRWPSHPSNYSCSHTIHEDFWCNPTWLYGCQNSCTTVWETSQVHKVTSKAYIHSFLFQELGNHPTESCISHSLALHEGKLSSHQIAQASCADVLAALTTLWWKYIWPQVRIFHCSLLPLSDWTLLQQPKLYT